MHERLEDSFPESVFCFHGGIREPLDFQAHTASVITHRVPPCFLPTGSHCVPQASLIRLVFLPLLLRCYDSRYEPPFLVTKSFSTETEFPAEPTFAHSHTVELRRTLTTSRVSDKQISRKIMPTYRLPTTV